MIKNIIFDFGNVLGTFRARNVINNITSVPEEQEFLVNNVLNSPEWLQYSYLDSGFLTYEQIIKLINDRNNNKYSNLVEELINNYYKAITINPEMVNIVKKLKEKGYKLYVLSNTSKPVVDAFKNHEIFTYFDGFVLSYKINMVKPYDGIYKYLLDTYKLVPEECLFIDDLEANMATANKFGIKGRNVNKDDIDDIKKVLIEYNVLEEI